MKFRRPRVLAGILCVAALACGQRGSPNEGAAQGGAASPPPAGAPPERPKIVVLGDSLTAGLGLPETQAFPALLQQRIDRDGYEFEVVNAGVSGDTSAGALRRLDWALQGDVRVLIVAVGANDGLRGLSVGDMKRNLSEIVARARARNITVVLAGMEAPPNYGREYAVSFHRAFAELARQERVAFIPFLLDRVAGRSDLNQEDGIHPNAAGALIVADTVWAVLGPILDQVTTAR